MREVCPAACTKSDHEVKEVAPPRAISGSQRPIERSIRLLIEMTRKVGGQMDRLATLRRIGRADPMHESAL